MEIALIGPYFNGKSTKGHDIYFDLKKKTPMGIKYDIELQLCTDKNEGNPDYKISYIQFVAEDEISHCLPKRQYPQFIKR